MTPRSVSEPSPALVPLLLAFVVLWLVLDRSAFWLESFRGEAGVIVCVLVLAAAVAFESALAPKPPLRALADLGLRAPSARAIILAAALGFALLLFYPAYALATGTPFSLRADWWLLVPGLFAQGGIAEEAVFRGFLYRHLRAGRSFWRAALFAAVPFAAVHALLFFTLDFPVAFASFLLALAISFPFAWLFDRAAGSIWPPALLHFVIQGSIKLVDAGGGFAPMAVAWIALAAVLPWAVFLLRPKAGEVG